MKALCAAAGYTYQAHHAEMKRRRTRAEKEQRVLAAVRGIRLEMPELGTRKLKHMLAEELQLHIGRDELFALLREKFMLVQPKRSYMRTTDSRHGLRVFENHLSQLDITRVNQAWVADLTYIATGEGFRYLALITDAYSRKIIGYDFSASLSIEGSMRALSMAIAQLPHERDGELWHHSDRGVQYCSHAYSSTLRRHGVSISMADVGDPYQNAMAERINGILKQEFHLDARFADEATARRAVDQAIRTYNTRRPHLSLDYRTPEQVHSMSLQGKAA